MSKPYNHSSKQRHQSAGGCGPAHVCWGPAGRSRTDDLLRERNATGKTLCSAADYGACQRLRAHQQQNTYITIGQSISFSGLFTPATPNLRGFRAYIWHISTGTESCLACLQSEPEVLIVSKLSGNKSFFMLDVDSPGVSAPLLVRCALGACCTHTCFCMLKYGTLNSSTLAAMGSAQYC